MPSDGGQRALYCLDVCHAIAFYLEWAESFHHHQNLFVLYDNPDKGLKVSPKWLSVGRSPQLSSWQINLNLPALEPTPPGVDLHFVPGWYLPQWYLCSYCTSHSIDFCVTLCSRCQGIVSWLHWPSSPEFCWCFYYLQQVNLNRLFPATSLRIALLVILCSFPVADLSAASPGDSIFQHYGFLKIILDCLV